VVIPAEGRDRIGCLANQVKPTRSLVQDLNEDIKEIQHLGNHGEESSQKITELEALCKHKKDATTKLKEEKVNLVGMFQSHDEVIMEIVDEFGLNYMGENNDDEDEDDNDGGETTTPPATVPPLAIMPPVDTPKVIIVEEEDNPMEMVPEQEAPEELEIIASDVEPKPPQPRLYTMLMRDYEESPSRMMDDLDDSDHPTEAEYDMN
jgi:hypothetical protein